MTKNAQNAQKVILGPKSAFSAFLRFLTSGAFIWAYYSKVSCVLAEASELLQKFCRVASFDISRKYKNDILHKFMNHVKVMENDMRDLEFSSSGRRGNGGPKAPERILVAKVIFELSGSQKCKIWSKKQKMSNFGHFCLSMVNFDKTGFQLTHLETELNFLVCQIEF